MRDSRRIVDLSHPITSGMETYPGLPRPRIEPHLTHAASRPFYQDASEFTITRYFMVGSTGTYLDSPWHRHPEGGDLSALDLSAIVDLDGVCVTVSRDEREIRLPDDGEALRGTAVLVRTDWSEHWGTAAYWEPGPYLGREAVATLVRAQPAVVGVDFWNVDDLEDLQRPAHTELLAAGIPIIEHLTALDRLPARGFRFFAAPPAIVGGASFPVRAFAVLG